MKLTQKNLLAWLENHRACPSGMVVLNKLLRKATKQKRGLRTVFEEMKRRELEFNDYQLAWAVGELTGNFRNERDEYIRALTFEKFKSSFEKLAKIDPPPSLLY